MPNDRARLSMVPSGPPHARQGSVHRPEIKLLGLEPAHRLVDGRGAPSPLDIVIELLVGGVENNFQELLVAWHAANVLRRAVTLTSNADWPDSRRRYRQNFL